MTTPKSLETSSKKKSLMERHNNREKVLVENFTSPLESGERVIGMKETFCPRCAWTWMMYEHQTPEDCPFCPSVPWGYSFTAP